MSDMNHRHRQPEGTPTGGQFAAEIKPESGAAGTLTADIPAYLSAYDPADARMILDAIGEGPDLNEREQEMLAVLLDDGLHSAEGYDDDLDSIVENLTSWGESDDFYDVKAIASLVQCHQGDAFHFNLGHDEGGSVENYEVGYFHSGPDHGYFVNTHDVKYLDGRSASGTSGLRQALDIAATVDADFCTLGDRVTRLGLKPSATPTQAPDPATAAQALAAGDEAAIREMLQGYLDADRAERAAEKPSAWPNTPDEREAFEDWKHEVGEGDTNASFRDWYTDRRAEESVED